MGKTTTAVNLSACLGEAGQRVLLVDFDPQGNASSGLLAERPEDKKTIYELICGNCSEEDCLIRDAAENLDLIPADMNLAGCEAEFQDLEGMESMLKKALEKLQDQYDYIFIDCPPVEIVADAAIISNQADMTLFVVRAGLLERSMLPELDRLYADGKYRNLSVILNATEAVHRRYGYHKYGYSYGYNYSYYGN